MYFDVPLFSLLIHESVCHLSWVTVRSPYLGIEVIWSVELPFKVLLTKDSKILRYQRMTSCHKDDAKTTY